MKIISVQYENWKNIKDGEYDLKGKNIILLGENTMGKSNFMNGLQLVLGAKPGKHLIKDGEDRAVIQAILAEYENEMPIDDTVYKFRAVIKRDKGGDEKVALQVIMPDGEKHETKTMIGQIAGEINLENDFVALGKTAEGRRKQIEIVKSYLDQATIEALNAEKNKLKKVYDERTEVGRERDRVKTLIESSGLKFSDFENYKLPKNTTAIEASIANASKHNTTIDDVKARVKQRDESIDALVKKIDAMKLEVVELMDLNTKATEWLGNTSESDVATLQEELKSANEYNAMVKKVSDSNKWKKEHEEYIDQYGSLTAKHDSSVEAIKDAIKDMQMPVQGMSFDMDDSVYYNGKLISEDTLSFAECKLLNIELLKARNNNAKVIFISNGESVGANFLRELQKFAEDNDYQLIMEEVLRGQEELTIEMMPAY